MISYAFGFDLVISIQFKGISYVIQYSMLCLGVYMRDLKGYYDSNESNETVIEQKDTRFVTR